MNPPREEAGLDDVRVRGRLRLARRVAGLRLVDAGAKLGISHTGVSKIERGTSGLEQWHLEALAPLYGVSVRWIRSGEPASEGPTTSVGEADLEALPEGIEQRQRLLGLLDDLPGQVSPDEARELREARELMERCADRLQEELAKYGKLHRVLHAILGPPESLQRAFDMFAQAYDNLVVMGGAPPREGGVYPQE